MIKEKNTTTESKSKGPIREENKSKLSERNDRKHVSDISNGTEKVHKFASVSKVDCLQISEIDPKPSASNVKRLDALKKKQKCAEAQKSLIKDALQNIDKKKTGNSDGLNHIVFNDEGNEEPQQKSHPLSSNTKVIQMYCTYVLYVETSCLFLS